MVISDWLSLIMIGTKIYMAPRICVQILEPTCGRASHATGVRSDFPHMISGQPTERQLASAEI